MAPSSGSSDDDDVSNDDGDKDDEEKKEVYCKEYNYMYGDFQFLKRNLQFILKERGVSSHRIT